MARIEGGGDNEAEISLTQPTELKSTAPIRLISIGNSEFVVPIPLEIPDICTTCKQLFGEPPPYTQEQQEERNRILGDPKLLDSIHAALRMYINLFGMRNAQFQIFLHDYHDINAVTLPSRQLSKLVSLLKRFPRIFEFIQNEIKHPKETRSPIANRIRKRLRDLLFPQQAQPESRTPQQLLVESEAKQQSVDVGPGYFAMQIVELQYLPKLLESKEFQNALQCISIHDIAPKLRVAFNALEQPTLIQERQILHLMLHHSALEQIRTSQLWKSDDIESLWGELLNGLSNAAQKQLQELGFCEDDDEQFRSVFIPKQFSILRGKLLGLLPADSNDPNYQSMVRARCAALRQGLCQLKPQTFTEHVSSFRQFHERINIFEHELLEKANKIAEMSPNPHDELTSIDVHIRLTLANNLSEALVVLEKLHTTDPHHEWVRGLSATASTRFAASTTVSDAMLYPPVENNVIELRRTAPRRVVEAVEKEYRTTNQLPTLEELINKIRRANLGAEPTAILAKLLLAHLQEQAGQLIPTEKPPSSIEIAQTEYKQAAVDFNELIELVRFGYTHSELFGMCTFGPHRTARAVLAALEGFRLVIDQRIRADERHAQHFHRTISLNKQHRNEFLENTEKITTQMLREIALNPFEFPNVPLDSQYIRKAIADRGTELIVSSIKLTRALTTNTT